METLGLPSNDRSSFKVKAGTGSGKILYVVKILNFCKQIFMGRSEGSSCVCLFDFEKKFKACRHFPNEVGRVRVRVDAA